MLSICTFVGYQQDIYRVSYKLLYIHMPCMLRMSIFIVCSRFTLIVDNAVSLSESCDFVDQQIVADIIRGHTSEHHQHDTLLSYSDFEQVLMCIATLSIFHVIL